MSIEVNGVTLPDIPSEVLEQYPYAVIVYDTYAAVSTGYLLALCDTAITATIFLGDTESIAYGIRVIVETGLLYSCDPSASSDWTPLYDGENLFSLPLDYSDNLGVSFQLMWSNHDIYEATCNESDYSDITVTDTIYFARNDSDPNYFAPKSWFDGMARQVMRLMGTSDKLNTDEMLELAKGVEVGGGLTAAEDGAFGVDSAGEEYGITEMTQYATNNYAYTCGLKIVPAETFNITGFRLYRYSNHSVKSGVKLWDASGNLLAESDISFSVTGAWENIYLDTPVNVSAGETYTVGVYMGGYSLGRNAVYNGKLTSVTPVADSGEVYPPTTEQSVLFGIVDFIIGATTEELPDSYEVQRTTMDSIASEVQRIAGADTKLSPAQIITALQGVTV